MNTTLSSKYEKPSDQKAGQVWAWVKEDIYETNVELGETKYLAIKAHPYIIDISKINPLSGEGIKAIYTELPFGNTIEGNNYLGVLSYFKHEGARVHLDDKYDIIFDSPVNLAAANRPLDKIYAEIKYSKSLLDLKSNWDDNDAIPINPIILNRATSFLENYAKRILDLYRKTLITPSIMPVSDGSIDLEWTTKSSSFLINFKNSNEEVAFYYGEYRDNETILFDTNGQVSTQTINDKFASYLADLS
jgi:hypothetical protein